MEAFSRDGRREAHRATLELECRTSRRWLKNMKTHIAATLAFLASFTLATAEDVAIHEGKYILVRSGEGVEVDPEVVTISEDGDNGLKMEHKLFEIGTTSSVQLIPSGSSEGKDFTEVIITTVATIPTGGRNVDNQWKITAYGMYSLTLHGTIRSDGLVRGAFVTTEASKRKTHVGNGQFVLKPLNPQQAGADQPATAPESKLEDDQRPEEESEGRSQ